MHGFDELTENEKDKLFENSIQAYIQHPEELKQKGKKVAMKIISHDWRSYKSKLVRFGGTRTPPSISTKICQKKTGRDLLKSANKSTLREQSVHVMAPIAE
jgi:hypothetical protein